MSDAAGSEPLAILVDRLRNGDHAAFEAIFREHYAGLCDFANRFVAAPDVAEEIVQDVLAGLWNARSRLEITVSLRAWLYRSVRNRALNHVKRVQPERPLPAGTTGPAAPTSPESDLIANDITRRLDVALAALPERCREAMVLRWKHGLGHAEIADSMGVSIKAVERHITRGIAALRALLGPRD